jgi:NAD(P)-dependent dehydrogenase (short-subunit alcohol dehydrogenase family)
MIAQGSGGRIVLTSSIAYVEGGGLHGPYGASKGAVSTLTRSMAAEWAQYGILVNAVCPGLTRTNINREVWEDPALYQELTAKIPLRRMAEPGEVASLMTYLCTEAAGFITGSIIHCDGGATVGGL